MKGVTMKLKVVLLLSLLLPAWAVAADAGVKNPDTIIQASALNQESLDPYFQYDITSNEVCKNVYENLLAWVGESVTDYKPHLSTMIPSQANGLVSADGRVYTFPIRKNVKFHNGNDLTPEDIEYTFERAMIFDRAGGPSWMILEPLTGYSTIESIVEAEGGVPYPKMFDQDGNLTDPAYKDILIRVFEKYVAPSVEVSGDNVVITLKTPYAPFLSELPQGAGWFSILDKEWSIAQGAWDGKTDSWWKYHDPKAEKDPLYSKMNGTGPYKLVKWDNGVEVVLERFEGYWGEKPQSKYVKILTMPEWSTRKAALLAGDVDMASVDPQYLSQVEGQPGIRVHKQLDQLSVYMLFFNQTIKVEGGQPLRGQRQTPTVKVSRPIFLPIFMSAKHFPICTTMRSSSMTFRLETPSPPTDLWSSPLLGYTAKEPGYNHSMEKAAAEFKLAFGGKLWDKGFKLVAAYATGRMVDKGRFGSDLLQCPQTQSQVQSGITEFCMVHLVVRLSQWRLSHVDSGVECRLSRSPQHGLPHFTPHRFLWFSPRCGLSHLGK